MNILIYSLIIFVLVYIVLKFLANMSTKKLSRIVRLAIAIFSLLLASLFAFGGKILFSLPLILISLGIIKLKGLTLFQLFNLYRLIRVLQNSGRFSFNHSTQSQSSTTMSLNEAYKILNLDPNKKYTKEEIKKAHLKLMKKLHPDVSPETAKLSEIVNNARDTILKEPNNLM